MWLEITNLDIPTWTDDLGMITRMCDWLVQNGLQECPLHFSRFSPLYKLTQLPLTPVSTLEKARDIAVKAGVHFVYIGNVPGHWAENTYCHKCGKMIIELEVPNSATTPREANASSVAFVFPESGHKVR